MKTAKHIIVYEIQLEETLLKEMNKNLKLEVHIGHYIQAFLSLVRFAGLLNYPLSIK